MTAVPNALRLYVQRRRAVAAEMGEGVAFIATAPEVIRNRDTHHAYRPDSYFHYLCGFPEPDAVLVIIAGAAPRSLLFCRDKNPEREIWDGYRYGPAAAAEAFGVNAAYPLGQLNEMLPDLLVDQPALYTLHGNTPWLERQLNAQLGVMRRQTRTGRFPPSALLDLHPILDRMRLHKDSYEIDLMRHAGAIAAGAHTRAMAATRPGAYEYEIEAELLHEFVRHGARSPAYPSIVASGPNSCVLHYVENNRQMNDGELLLIDAGCEYEGYASDVTRSFPVNGRFSGPQREIYELVLAAQVAAIDAVQPGQPFTAYHEVATQILAEGLIDLGLCRGSLAEVMETGSYKQFYMHRAGHWLGRDVHDAGDYALPGGVDTVLEPGMVLTVEPGLYVRPAENVPEAYWNIGVRIEDDVVVTDRGNEVLTATAPKTVSAIEAVMQR